jgi:ribosomal protein S18 acetylase RimI-like enzyme
MLASPLSSSHLKSAAAVLARSFYTDPYFTFTLPDESRRARLLPWIFERLISYALRYGAVYTTPSVEGVAVWLGPQKVSMDWIGTIRTGLFLLPLKLSRQEARRNLLLDRLADRFHSHAVAGPHWYLLVLGVDPTHQGQGIGGLLLQPVLEQADRQGLPCYLETNNEKNLRFYERHGFSLKSHGKALENAPFTWAMLREPA